MPLPFSKLCFYFGDLIFVDRALDEAGEALLREEIEKKLNFAQDESWRMVAAVKSN